MFAIKTKTLDSGIQIFVKPSCFYFGLDRTACPQLSDDISRCLLRYLYKGLRILQRFKGSFRHETTEALLAQACGNAISAGMVYFSFVCSSLLSWRLLVFVSSIKFRGSTPPIKHFKGTERFE